MDKIPLFIPKIHEMAQGTNYDLALSERASYANEFTTHPIEDPKRSFLVDHSRESPTELDVTLLVSTEPCAAGAVPGIERLVKFQDDLLALRAAQSVSVSSYLTVYTGVREYRNMALARIDFERDADVPNEMRVFLGLQEFRFAVSPRHANELYAMDANDGTRNKRNETLAAPVDRPVVEATQRREVPRFRLATPNHETIIRVALRKLGVPRLTGLDLALHAAGVL